MLKQEENVEDLGPHKLDTWRNMDGTNLVHLSQL